MPDIAVPAAPIIEAERACLPSKREMPACVRNWFCLSCEP